MIFIFCSKLPISHCDCTSTSWILLTVQALGTKLLLLLVLALQSITALVPAGLSFCVSQDDCAIISMSTADDVSACCARCAETSEQSARFHSQISGTSCCISLAPTDSMLLLSRDRGTRVVACASNSFHSEQSFVSFSLVATELLEPRVSLLPLNIPLHPRPPSLASIRLLI